MVLGHNICVKDGSPQRTDDIAIDSDVTFNSMLLAPRTLGGLTGAGFTRPSPVQLQGIPSGKCGFNLLLEAKSGTGKTAVFAVVALDLLDAQPDSQALILAPTREIAAQITDVVRQIGSQYQDLRVEVVMGGLPLSEDIAKFANKRKVHVIVGSPGRLRHLIEDGHISTDSVRLFVLDEADKLMEESFKADINYIFSSLPNCKQVIMSSATYPEELKQLVVKYMSKYLHICPNSTSILLGIEQKVTVIKHNSNVIMQTQLRYNELIKIFKSRQFKQCLIFCNYQARVIEVCKKLKSDKWPAQSLYGKQEQTDRLDALKILQEYKCRILVSTDLAARGIDASNVDLVINFEIPYEWATYLHRIGRAGRYGSYGMAISIVSAGKEETHFKSLLKSIGAPINMKTLWTEEPLDLTNVEENGLEVYTNGSVVDESIHKNKVYNNLVSTDQLWDVINNKDEILALQQNDSIVIEDFNDLNASYNNVDGIDSFDNLLSSYEETTVDVLNTPFATFDVTFSTISKCVSNNLSRKEHENKIEYYNSDNKEIPQMNGESGNLLNGDSSSPVLVKQKRFSTAIHNSSFKKKRQSPK